jgi:hypothetical protein
MQEEKVRIGRLLGTVRDEKLLQRTLEFAMSVSRLPLTIYSIHTPFYTCATSVDLDEPARQCHLTRIYTAHPCLKGVYMEERIKVAVVYYRFWKITL